MALLAALVGVLMGSQLAHFLVAQEQMVKVMLVVEDFRMAQLLQIQVAGAVLVQLAVLQLLLKAVMEV
jgi:hypothetical protein